MWLEPGAAWKTRHGIGATNPSQAGEQDNLDEMVGADAGEQPARPDCEGGAEQRSQQEGPAHLPLDFIEQELFAPDADPADAANDYDRAHDQGWNKGDRWFVRQGNLEAQQVCQQYGIEPRHLALKRREPNARVIKKIDQAGFFAAMRQALL